MNKFEPLMTQGHKHLSSYCYCLLWRKSSTTCDVQLLQDRLFMKTATPMHTSVVILNQIKQRPLPAKKQNISHTIEVKLMMYTTPNCDYVSASFN